MGCVQSLLAVDPDLSEEYDLVKSLGRGVEGEVWLGVHKITGAQVAIKLVQRYAKQACEKHSAYQTTCLSLPAF